MARQIDCVRVTLCLVRQDDGTYVKSLQEIEGRASDPAPASGKRIDQGPWVGFPITTPYDGGAKLDAFLDTVLADAKSEAGAP